MPTITIQPKSLVYKSSGFTNYARMWDGNLDTYSLHSSTSYGYFGISLSQIPAGASITNVKYRAYDYRSGSSDNILRARLGYVNGSTRTNVTSAVSFECPPYHEKTEVSATQAVTSSQSSTLLSAASPFVAISLAATGSHEIYEFYIDITYSLPSYTVSTAVSPTGVGEISGGYI